MNALSANLGSSDDVIFRQTSVVWASEQLQLLRNHVADRSSLSEVDQPSQSANRVVSELRAELLLLHPLES